MNKNFKKALLTLTSLATLFSAASCDFGKSSEEPQVSVEELKATAQSELNAKFDAIDRGAYDDATLATIDEIKTLADSIIANATTKEELDSGVATVKEQLETLFASAKKYASGVYSYVAASYEVRTQILGILEAYAYEHFLTGFSLIDDGGYAIRRPEVKQGTDKYIPGYGWATLSDGSIDGDLPGESKTEWKRYLHSYETSDPGQINYADDKGSVVGDLIGYCGSSYWGTRMNETKDGYEWYSELAKEKPIAVNANAKTGLATQYKFRIKTGDDGLYYNTLSSKADIAAYAGRKVEAEDYLTIYKMKYTKKNGWARATEDIDGSGSIKGTAAYYNSSAEGYSDDAWANVGLKVEKVNGEWTMSVEFNTPCSPFYAMYYLSSSMYTPCPMGFIQDTLGNGSLVDGAALFGKTSIDAGLTPVDTFLSCGPYVIENWVTDDAIVFKKNDKFTSEGGKYNIDGIHLDILSAMNDDPNAAIKEFENGNLSSCGVPTQYLATYKNYSNTDAAKGVVGISYYTPGSGNYKLNVNACDQELWNSLFGKEGSIEQTAEEDYWVCEPAMSNQDFLLGLSYSIDRVNFAANLGRGPSINYFGDAYLSDPENGVVYNTTDAHKEAIAQLTATNEYGYDLETAKAYFKKACEKFIADGTYKSGDTIKIEIAWQTTSQFTNYGNPLIGYWQDAFNAVGKDYGLTLEVTNWAGAVWTDVYYKKMMVGQFDIGFGSISGNSLNPLNFLEVLKSDNSSGFTLNWGADTSVVNLEYDGVLWSFDSLWQATETGGYFSKGQFTPTTDPEIVSAVANQDGSYTVTAKLNPIVDDEIIINVASVAFDGYNAAGKYTEFACDFTYDNATGVVTVTVSKEAAEALVGETVNGYYSYFGGSYVMFDFYLENTIAEVPVSETKTADGVFEEFLPQA